MEKKEDTISRQAAINAIEVYFDGLPIKVHYDMIAMIHRLPAAQLAQDLHSACADTISRQAAIDSMCELMRHWFGCDPKDEIREIKRELGKLPSAQPQRMRGRWMPHNEICREYIGTILVNVRYDYWLCDACGYRVEKGQPMYNFCPNCGSYNGGEQE